MLSSMNCIRSMASRVRTASLQRLNNAVRPSPAQCTVAVACCTTTAAVADEDGGFHEMVQKYYGKTLETNADLKTNACTSSPPPATIRAALSKVPDEVLEKYYGCGSPLPFGLDGLTVLDLGSGSGRDCYIAAQLVGEQGSVVGVDMTDEQLEVARRHSESFCTETLGYKASNMRFVKGFIEMLPSILEPESVDIIISNCVVNLSPRKDKVLSGAYSVLKEGGEFYFSDVYCDRRLSTAIQNDEVLVGECLGGALYTEDFRREAQKAGFADPRVLSVSEISVGDAKLQHLLGNAKFYSITYRLFKQSKIEDRCEDFGQVAVYNGSIAEHPHYYDLDDHHRFYTGKPMLVCGNSAVMVGETWLGKHFTVTGDTENHFGLFDCSPLQVTPKEKDQAVASSGGGGCC